MVDIIKFWRIFKCILFSLIDTDYVCTTEVTLRWNDKPTEGDMCLRGCLIRNSPGMYTAIEVILKDIFL